MIILVLIILFLILMIYFLKPSAKENEQNGAKLAPEPLPIKDDQPKNYEVIWDQLSPGEKAQYIADTYFNLVPKSEEDDKIARENAYIASLPQDGTSCQDGFDQCPIWADNNECTINPEFMLYNCASSCKACALNADQKNKLDKIYNSRPPVHCVYHGEDYPGEFQYLNRLYDYTVAVGY